MIKRILRSFLPLLPQHIQVLSSFHAGILFLNPRQIVINIFHPRSLHSLLRVFVHSLQGHLSQSFLNSVSIHKGFVNIIINILDLIFLFILPFLEFELFLSNLSHCHLLSLKLCLFVWVNSSVLNLTIYFYSYYYIFLFYSFFRSCYSLSRYFCFCLSLYLSVY